MAFDSEAGILWLGRGVILTRIDLPEWRVLSGLSDTRPVDCQQQS
jgi:hypothetical protein